MINLYIDFDGVIANTIEISYKMFDNQGLEKSYENYLEFYRTLDWKNLLSTCKPINNSFKCIKKIIDSGKYNVSILTHITSFDEADAKIKYIRKYLKDITIIPVPKSVSKTEMIKVEGSVLVDDFVDNLKQWKEKGGFGIRFDLDMDGKGFPVVDKLDMVIKIIETNFPINTIKK